MTTHATQADIQELREEATALAVKMIDLKDTDALKEILRQYGVQRVSEVHPNNLPDFVRDLKGGQRVPVILFRKGGKYYTEELWRKPPHCTGPYDMRDSPDFRRVDDGPVLVYSREWGYPHLLVAES